MSGSVAPTDTRDFASAIYEGTVRHRRFAAANRKQFTDGDKNTVLRQFDYRVFMVYLDLQELDAVFAQTPLWSHKRGSLAWLRRKDYLDGGKQPLYESVSQLVEEKTGKKPQGAIRMLSNLRTFGFIINPITCYYCFDATGEQVETIVAEVTNTPWRQRCCYVLPVNQTQQQDNTQRLVFDKAMHVSPFQSADMVYHWLSQTPDDTLRLHIDVKKHKDQQSVLDATMTLERRAMSAKNMNGFLLRYPWMTVKVFAAIYWQAIKLLWQRQQFYRNVTKSKFSVVANNK